MLKNGQGMKCEKWDELWMKHDINILKSFTKILNKMYKHAKNKEWKMGDLNQVRCIKE